jgi:hypothetical protein
MLCFRPFSENLKRLKILLSDGGGFRRSAVPADDEVMV